MHDLPIAPSTGAGLAEERGMTEPPEIVVDARGHRCPVPTLRLQRALRDALPGQKVRLIADDPLARVDAPHFLASHGYELVETGVDGAVLTFVAIKPADR